MPSSVRLQSIGLCSEEWLEHSLRGGSAQKYKYIETVFDSAQAECLSASADRCGEAARPDRSRRGGVRQPWGAAQNISTDLLTTSSQARG